MSPLNIALVGPRGAGKTTVARSLAVATEWPALSTDTLVSYEAAGASIPQLVASSGGTFAEFREREYQVLGKVCRLHEVILDCGGGIVVDLDEDGGERFSERKVALLHAHSLIFFLHPRLEDVAEEIVGDQRRPSLGDASPQQIYEQRLPWYRRAAHHELAVRAGGLQAVVAAVRDAMHGAGLLERAR